ncbi:hypothetical protein [Flavihumibacter solisilvae]|uniref:N-acetyltransferase domain-containing protein n=1 Tax=Flavihumibacter solisilvae TaxID=1349421 RepID=A0A0C1L0M9_9BACT|nr:hypothetical protein [Flavihumibacter solisilvae]KIC93547.1 hypothetical protein OI18_17555 [Flavihumibacter solisilvae]
MANEVTLVQSVNPFAKHPPVLTWTDGEGDVAWQVRPLWIIKDLMCMHKWLNNVNCLTNQAFNRNEASLISHYRNRLWATEEQSFIVQRKEQLVGQLDIIPAAVSSLAMMHPVAEDELALYYVFPGEHLSVEYWLQTMAYFCKLALKFYPVTSLYLEIPVDQRILHSKVGYAGFRQVNEYWNQERQVHLYMISDSEH